MKIPPELCARCKGYKRLCSLPKCPILEAFQAQVRAYIKLRGLEAQGSTPPSVIVGEYGYPEVSLYYMVPPEVYGDEARVYDDPVGWSESRVSLGDIIKFRGELLSARLAVRVDRPETLYEREVGLAGLSEKPVDSEVHLEKMPIPSLKFDGITKPIGPRAPARLIKVTGNASLNPSVEKILWDDFKASEAIVELYNRGVNVYTLQRLLSLGFLGKKPRRRIVPTRWAITAVDDTISRGLREKLKGAREIEDTRVYYNEYLGNKFLVVVKPGAGRFEWLEIWQPRSFWVKSVGEPIVWRVYEDSRGNVSSMDGGFSAARLAALEWLASRGRRADVVIVREITPNYYAPLGNWHIRETVRRAFTRQPLAVNPNMGELLTLLGEKVNYDPNSLFLKLRILKAEKTLEDYLR